MDNKIDPIIPEYARDAVYQEMVRLCDMIGLKVRYCDLSDRIMGRSDRYHIIEMSKEDIYKSPENAAKVLGHELAHSITDHMIDSEDGEEIDCDRIGEALYVFADLISLHKCEEQTRKLFQKARVK